MLISYEESENGLFLLVGIGRIKEKVGYYEIGKDGKKYFIRSASDLHCFLLQGGCRQLKEGERVLIDKPTEFGFGRGRVEFLYTENSFMQSQFQQKANQGK